MLEEILFTRNVDENYLSVNIILYIALLQSTQMLERLKDEVNLWVVAPNIKDWCLASSPSSGSIGSQESFRLYRKRSATGISCMHVRMNQAFNFKKQCVLCGIQNFKICNFIIIVQNIYVHVCNMHTYFYKLNTHTYTIDSRCWLVYTSIT